MGEAGGIGQRLRVGSGRLDTLPAYGRHQQYVAVVAAAGSAEVGMREAVDGRVAVMIAGAGVPAVDARVGAWLNHAVGNDRTGEGVAVVARSDKRVDVLGIVGCRQCQACREQEQGRKALQESEGWFHRVFYGFNRFL